jgi:type VI secretion system secreted protein Hcp
MRVSKLFQARPVTAVLTVAGVAVLIVGSLGLYGATSTSPAPTQQAANDYFLKIEGIEGESTDERYRGWIELESFGWGDSLPGLQQRGSAAAGGGGGAGKVVFQNFQFTTKSSKATPNLILACASGEHFKEALLVVRKSGEARHEFLKFRLSDVLVSSYQTGGGVNTSELMDRVSLDFARFEVEYQPQNVDGAVGEPIRAGWDIRANVRTP